MSDNVFHFGGDYSHAEPDSCPSIGEHGFIVRCGLPRAEVLWVRTYNDWLNAHVDEWPCCQECTRIVAVETGAVAGSA